MKKRRKGYNLENLVVNLAKQYGLKARRQWLSGAGENYDVEIEGMRGECKSRRGDFKRLYDWLERKDFLVIKQDRKKPLFVCELKLFLEKISKEEKGEK